jgi:hypothetical protein
METGRSACFDRRLRRGGVRLRDTRRLPAVGRAVPNQSRAHRQPEAIGGH